MTNAFHPWLASRRRYLIADSLTAFARRVFNATSLTILLGIAVSGLASSVSAADETAKKPFEIPAGVAPASFKDFSAQAGGLRTAN